MVRKNLEYGKKGEMGRKEEKPGRGEKKKQGGNDENREKKREERKRLKEGEAEREDYGGGRDGNILDCS